MITEYRHTKQITRLMKGSSQLLAILMSKLRSSLGGAWEEPRRSLERYCTGGQTPCAILVRCLRTASSQPTNCQFAAYGLFRILLLLFVLLGTGIGNVWGQITPTTDTSNPVYYLFQSFGNTGFYMRPNNTAVSTLNILTDDMKWYFLDSGDGYYYICDKAGRYLYFSKPSGSTSDRTWMALKNSLDNNDTEHYKFSIAKNNTKGWDAYNIIPYGNADKYCLNKQGRNAGDNGVQVANGWDDENSNWVFIPLTTYEWTLRADCFRPSDTSNKYFYQIKSRIDASYYIKPGATYVETSNTVDDDMIWYFEEAASDELMTYYYIRHANTGKYLRYRSNAVAEDNAIELANHTGSETGDDEARFQFIVVRGAVSNEPWNTSSIFYNIVPKLLESTSSDCSIKSVSNNKGLGKPLKTRSNRTSNDTQWSFVSVEYSTVCANPTITFSSSTGNATISTVTTRSTIYYTIDGTEPSSSNGTEYTAPFDVTEQTTIKAIVTRPGFTDSEVTTKTIYKVATPTIQDNGNYAVSITSGTEGATIYYTIDGSDPTTSSTEYTAPLTENISGVLIKAIAVKDNMINSDIGEGEIDIKCVTPVITYDNSTSKVSITSTTPECSIYYTTNGDTPTTSSTPFSDPFSIDNQTEYIKAIATKSGYADSEIAFVKVVLNPTITLAQTEYTYNGSAIEPTVSSVKDGETPIDIGEYTVDYRYNTNAGTATVNIVDNPGGAYLVSGSTTFTINPVEVTLTANSGTETYDGTEKTVSGFTSSVGEPIFAGVSASGSGTNVGTYDVTFTGVNIGTTMDTSGNCVVTNIVNGTLTISQKSIGDGEVAADDITISFVDNTSDEVEVEHGERTLTSDDYTVSVVDDGLGYQVATVTGKGNYTGSAKISRIKFSFFNSGSDDENVKNVATIAASMDIVTPDNMVAYIVTGLNVTKHEVKLTSIEYVPKDVPVLLLTDSPVEAYTATPKAVTTPADVSRNILMILPPGKKVEASQVYMFHQGQFFLTTAGTLTKYKFCLENPYYELVSPVKPNPLNAPLRFVIEGLTGIHEIQTAGIEGTSEDIWFSVDGLRLTGKPTRKGLYIKNGNKIVVK